MVLVLLLSMGCSDTPEQEAPPEPVSKLASLGTGWNAVEPGGDTICSDGSPFKFFVRPGSESARDEKIHFYLEGGGACWDGATCDLEGRPTYTPVVDETDGQSSQGVFNIERADNPLKDYTTIFVPYCGADVHLGDRTVEYTSPPNEAGETRTFTIEHHGLDNGRAALNWMYEHVDDPETVFVSGSSAGSIPSPIYAHWIAEHWPNARIAQLGDGAGGYRGSTTQSRPYLQWGTLEELDWEELTALDDQFSFEDLYISAASRSGNVQYAQYDTAEDSVQLQFLQLGGSATDSLQPLLDANHEEIRAADPDFRAFVAGGELHTILRRPEVYTYRVGDTSFLQWLTALVNGDPLNDVHCDDCSVAEGTTEAQEAESGSTE